MHVHTLVNLAAPTTAKLGCTSLSGSVVRHRQVSVASKYLKQRRAKQWHATCRALQTPRSGSPGTTLRAGGDPGSWSFSPEWFGTQGGNWGRDEGEIVFEQQSHHGNGLVRVTRHPASKQDPIPLHKSAACKDDADRLRQSSQERPNGRQYQEWRVLRFNEETVQSVARATVFEEPSHRKHVEQRPDCMAFLYMKSIAAAVSSMVGLAPEGSSLASALVSGSSSPCRAMCIGLGGGSLPIFLAHHFPGMEIDVVELDPVVIAAAQQEMGYPKQRSRLRIHNADAVAWLQSRCKANAPPLDMIFVDAFDGDNNVPEAFTDAGHPFMMDLAKSLHPDHGMAVVNLHRGGFPSIWQKLVLRFSGEKWADPYVTPTAEVYKKVVLPQGNGIAYTLGVGKQYNTIVIAARGKHLQTPDLEAQLQLAARRVQQAVNIRFKIEERSVLDFREV